MGFVGMPYFGDFSTSKKTVYMPFFTTDSSGTPVSMNITNVRIAVSKNGTAFRGNNSGISVATDIKLTGTNNIGNSTITMVGYNAVTIDLSDNAVNGFYAAGNDYQVFLSSIVADTLTEVPVGSFSIENRTVGLVPTAVTAAVGGATWDVARNSHTATGTFGESVLLNNTEINSIITAIKTTTYDGITQQSVMEMLVAFLAGRATVSTSGSTRTITYKKRDGSTSKFTIDASTNDGSRSAGGTIF